MESAPLQQRGALAAANGATASPLAAERSVAPAELVRRAAALSKLTGESSTAQARELGELLRHTTAILEAGTPPAALAAASRAASVLAPLQGRVSIPARFAAKFVERFTELDRAIRDRRAVAEAALRGTPPSVGRAATAPTPIVGLRPPGAPGGVAAGAAPLVRAATAPEPAPSRRDARCAGEALDRSAQQQARVQRQLDAQTRRSEQQASRTQARTEATQRQLDRGTPASSELARAAAAELAELEADARRR